MYRRCIIHIPVVLDGVISMVSALAAERLLSGVTDFIIPSHEAGSLPWRFCVRHFP